MRFPLEASDLFERNTSGTTGSFLSGSAEEEVKFLRRHAAAPLVPAEVTATKLDEEAGKLWRRSAGSFNVGFAVAALVETFSATSLSSTLV